MLSNPPPDYLDGAKVLKWAWSGVQPFGVIGPDAEDQVFGLAICQYEGSETFYRFSCDRNWAVIQDGLYDNIDLAIEQLPDQYKHVSQDWKDK